MPLTNNLIESRNFVNSIYKWLLYIELFCTEAYITNENKRKREIIMNTKKINEQAIESLKTYFNEGKDLIKENVTPLN